MNGSARVSLFNVFFRFGFRYPFRQYSLPSSLSSEPVISTSNFHSFSTITGIHLTIPHNLRNHRSFVNSAPESFHNQELDMINLEFAEAWDDIRRALKFKHTKDFDHELKIARAAVNGAVGKFEFWLARLPERERTAMQRSMVLKIEYLKTQLQQLDE